MLRLIRLETNVAGTVPVDPQLTQVGPGAKVDAEAQDLAFDGHDTVPAKSHPVARRLGDHVRREPEVLDVVA